MSTGLPAAPNGGMNLRNAASRSGGIVIKDSLLSMQASDSRTPEPPAPVMMTTFSPFGVGSTGMPRANSSMSRRDHAGLVENVLIDLVVAGQRAGVRARRLGARRGASGLQHHDRLFHRHSLGDLGK